MKVIVAIFVLACVLLLPAPAQMTDNKGRIEQVILQLEKEGREATVKNDLEVNDRLLADDWMNTNANGTVTTKAQLLELIKAGIFKIRSIETDDVKLRVYTDCVVVTGRSTSTREGRDGQVTTGQVRFTRVYAKIGNRWRIVSGQSTPIKQ